MGRGNRSFVYVLFGVCFVLVAVSLFLVFNIKKPLQVVEYDVYFGVINSGIGVDVNSSLLTFGHVNPGGGGTRLVVLDNNYDFPVFFEFLVSENLLGLVNVDGGEHGMIVVESGNNVTVPVRLSVPSDFELGNYTGKARIEIYRFKGRE